MKTVFSIRHHRGYDCGHNHRLLKNALRCLKKHMRLQKFTCSNCKAERLGFRVTKCRKCKCEDIYSVQPYDPDYFVINASDDGGRSWRILTPLEQHEVSEIWHGRQYKRTQNED